MGLLDFIFKSNKTSDFKTVKIGNQEWMLENLNVSTFRNGEPILEARTNKEWEKFGSERKPSWCYYDNKVKNGKKLYNWHAVNDSRSLAPKGWHIPSALEWNELEKYLGNSEAGTKMKNTSGWTEKGSGNNESGFSGNPGGGRRSNGIFSSQGSLGGWWSSTEYNITSAWYFELGSRHADVGRGSTNKGDAFSVRCLRDYESKIHSIGEQKQQVRMQVHIIQYYQVPRTEVFFPGGNINQSKITATVLAAAKAECTDPDGQWFAEPPRIGFGGSLRIELYMWLAAYDNPVLYSERLQSRLIKEGFVYESERGLRT